jgi:hypothetical protein
MEYRIFIFNIPRKINSWNFIRNFTLNIDLLYQEEIKSNRIKLLANSDFILSGNFIDSDYSRVPFFLYFIIFINIYNFKFFYFSRLKIIQMNTYLIG